MFNISSFPLCWEQDMPCVDFFQQNINPDATCVKELEVIYDMRLQTRRRCFYRWCVVKTCHKMTLGNGYLGSCIDEERSKMRYLV